MSKRKRNNLERVLQYVLVKGFADVPGVIKIWRGGQLVSLDLNVDNGQFRVNIPRGEYPKEPPLSLSVHCNTLAWMVFSKRTPKDGHKIVNSHPKGEFRFPMLHEVPSSMRNPFPCPMTFRHAFEQGQAAAMNGEDFDVSCLEHWPLELRQAAELGYNAAGAEDSE